MPAEGGIKFGQYVLLRRIARGGMAEVFLAQQRGLEGFDRRVAVKRILPHLADTPDFVKMFLGEARLAAQLAHPNVVHIYDFGKVDTDYFIAMEYVEGVHTGQLFKQNERERLSPTLIARIGADAAAALNYAHGLSAPNGSPLGLVHRDVSPANIMVSYDGIVKLCDFGIAKAASANANLTNPGQVKGKYAYMSPEQTIAAPLDGRSDVFSLGIVLWELITGKTIVGRGDAIEAMRAIRDGKLPSLASVAPATPPPLAKAINWALETKREKRATAADLAQALEAFIKGSPEIATPMQLAAFVRARYPRDPSGAMAAMQMPGAGTVASPGTSIETSDEIPAMKPTAPPKKPTPAPMKLREPKPPTLPPPVMGSGMPTPTVALSESALRDMSTHSGDDNDAFDMQETVSLDNPAVGPGAKPRSAPSVPSLAVSRSAPRIVPAPGMSAVHAQRRRPTGTPPMPTDVKSDAITIDPDVPSPLSRAIAGPMAPTPRVAAAGGMAADEPTRIDPSPPNLDFNETVVRSGPRIVPMANPGAIPTQAVAPLPPVGGYAYPQGAAVMTGQLPDVTAPVRKQLPRGLVVGLGLAGIAVFTFVVAIAAKSCAGSGPAAIDAAVVAVPPVAIDAAAPVVVPPPVVLDAELAVDAETTLHPEALTLLEVRTRPDGAMITIGDQTRMSPAKFALPAGKHTIVAELAGYEPEKREVELLATEHFSSEIAFMKKLPVQKGGGAARETMGRLTLRTTPYSEVYANGKKIGEAPFADMPLAPGVYHLEMKNPTHPTLSKTITIYAGKPAKFNWELPL